MKTNRKGGFTLIELLVVIAIIGILSSIVLVSLQAARKKGLDTRVIADVQQIRDALETGYNGSAYPDLTNGNAASVTATNASCYVANWLNSGGQANAIGTQVADACAEAGNTTDITIVEANTTGTVGGQAPVGAYAIYGRLVSNTSGYFCIDSTGNTNQADSAPGVAAHC